MRHFEAARIVLHATLAAITYGIVHDQITAHLCVEYFTIAHPPVFATQDPFLLALGWGVLATWWVGMILGTCLAAAARIGPGNKLTLSALRKPILMLMAMSGLAALLAGLSGAALVGSGAVGLPGYWAEIIPPDRHVVFSAAVWAHTASYAAGALGGLFMIVQALRRRKRGVV